ncbi:MAG: D-aminoacyl-tRNA deacylase [Candidatus Binatia bacterium]
MRVVIQRVTEAKVTVQGKEIGRIGPGLCLFLGVSKGDTEEDANYLAQKSMELRIFEDDTGKFSRSLLDVSGEILVVPEFTLYGDCTKGRRPSFGQTASHEEAKGNYHYFVKRLRDQGVKVATGQFQARMEVSMINSGPVTFIVDSK